MGPEKRLHACDGVLLDDMEVGGLEIFCHSGPSCRRLEDVVIEQEVRARWLLGMCVGEECPCLEAHWWEMRPPAELSRKACISFPCFFTLVHE